ncbi:MAG: hypothetical protein V4623_11150 [Pseudomonadota bacterium]
MATSSAAQNDSVQARVQENSRLKAIRLGGDSLFLVPASAYAADQASALAGGAPRKNRATDQAHAEVVPKLGYRGAFAATGFSFPGAANAPLAQSGQTFFDWQAIGWHMMARMPNEQIQDKQVQDIASVFEVFHGGKSILVTDSALYDPNEQALRVVLQSVQNGTKCIWQSGTNLKNMEQATPLRTIHIVVPKPNKISLQQHCFTKNPLGRFFNIIGSDGRFQINENAEVNITAATFPVEISNPNRGKPKPRGRILNWPQARGVLSTPYLCIRLHQLSPYSENTAIKQQLVALLETLNEITLNAKEYATYLSQIKFHFSNFNFTQLTAGERSALVQTIRDIAWELGERVGQLREKGKAHSLLGTQIGGTLEVSFAETGSAETQIFRTHWSSQRELGDFIAVEIRTHLAANPLPTDSAQNEYQSVEELESADSAPHPAPESSLPADWAETHDGVARARLLSSSPDVLPDPHDAEEIQPINHSSDLPVLNFLNPKAFAGDVFVYPDERDKDNDDGNQQSAKRQKS